MDFTEYIDNYAKKNTVYWAGGIPWRKYQGILRPVSPSQVTPDFQKGELKQLLKQARVPFAMWTYDGDPTTESAWWWVIAEKPYSIELLKKKDRYYIKRGIKNCDVKLISAKRLAHEGYDCYRSAMRRHTQGDFIDEVTFKERIPGYDNNKAYEIWGVFWSGKLVGYAMYMNIDNIAYQDMVMFDPEYFVHGSSYALIHITTDHYLNENNCLHVVAGERLISHETQYQDFLIKNFGYKKVYYKLGIEHTPSFYVISNIIYCSKFIWQKFPFLKKIKHKLNVAYELERIRRSK